MCRHNIQNGFTAPPPAYESVRTHVFREVMLFEFFRQLVIIQQRCCFYDDVNIIGYTGWRCGRIGKEQASGAASQKYHFIDKRAKLVNGCFKDLDIGVFFFNHHCLNRIFISLIANSRSRALPPRIASTITRYS